MAESFPAVCLVQIQHNQGAALHSLPLTAQSWHRMFLPPKDEMVLHTKKELVSERDADSALNTIALLRNHHVSGRIQDNLFHIQANPRRSPASSQSWDKIITPQWEWVINNDRERHLNWKNIKICLLKHCSYSFVFSDNQCKGWNVCSHEYLAAVPL